MRPRRFVIAGCGRSGTTYMARVLSDLGCACGHEAYFPSLERKGPFFFSPRHRFRVRALMAAWAMPPWGEAAWQAAPFIRFLPRGTMVFHQVRNPLAFIKSRQKKGLTFIPFRTRYCPVPAGCRDEAGFAALPPAQQAAYLAEFWVQWNRMIERAAGCGRFGYMRYRIEDVDAGHVGRMLETIRCPCPAEAVQRVIAGTERTLHSLGLPETDVTPDMLPAATREALRKLAAEYGYRI